MEGIRFNRSTTKEDEMDELKLEMIEKRAPRVIGLVKVGLRMDLETIRLEVRNHISASTSIVLLTAEQARNVGQALLGAAMRASTGGES